MARFDTAADLPGQTPVIWRRTRPSIALAVLAGVAWPPLILTLLVYLRHAGNIARLRAGTEPRIGAK